MTVPDLDRLLAFYRQFTLASVQAFPEFYARDASFKDPFNEVQGVEAIQRIFLHMFKQVDDARFEVLESIGDAGGLMLVWEFHYRPRIPLLARDLVMRGVSHLRFDGEGKVSYHRDYWDAAEELYMKLPGLSCLMRGMRRVLSASG